MSETITAPAPALTSIGFMDSAQCEFYRNQNGFLCLKYEGKDHGRVQVLRSLPLTMPNIYICVQNMENEELGILENLNSLPDKMAEQVQEDLAMHYYCPALSDITSIKEKMGFYYFDVLIGDYKKSFSIKDISKNIKQLKTGAIQLTDIDGNRYLIPDLSKISGKSARKIEPYLY